MGPARPAARLSRALLGPIHPTSAMRLCFIANPNSIHAQRWVRYFAGRGHDVHLIGDKPPAAAPPPDIHFHDLTRQANTRKLRYLTWSRTVRRLVRTIQPDVLHAHQVASAGWLGAAAGYHPLVVTSWGSDLLVGPRRSLFQRWLAQIVLRRADYVTAVSEELARIAQQLGSPADRTEVAPWGVDPAVFYPLPQAERPTQAPMVLSLRAIQALYNPLVVAAAIPQVLKAIPDVRFSVLTYNADPDLLAEFHRLVDDAQAAHAVEFVPPLANDQAVADLCRRADVALSVPSSDGTPKSVQEAMACGAVPVVSDLPALRPWLQHEAQGLVVPLGDSVALADAVIRLLTDDDLRRRLRAAGLKIIAERADARSCMQRYEQIYQHLAAGQRPQPPAAPPGEDR